MNWIIVIAACLAAFHPVAASDSIPHRPASWAQPMMQDGVPNLYRVTADLYRSAQPTAQGMRNLKALGVKTVIDLRFFHSDLNACDAAGLDDEAIPMTAWHPEREDVIHFLKIVIDPERTPVLVHCLHGADRTGAMCALYRIAVQGWTKEAAMREMVDGGFNFHPVFDNLLTWIAGLDMESIKKEAGIGIGAIGQSAGDPPPVAP